MNKFYMIIVVSYTIFNCGFCAELPIDIEKCHFGDSPCIIKTINDILHRYPKGIPEIGLPPLDETKMGDIPILDSPNRGPIWLTFYTRDNVFKGINNATATHVKGFIRDPTKSIIEVTAHIPSLVHDATYDMQGQWLLFKANTTGTLQSDFQNFHLTLTFKVILEYRNNKRYLKIYELVPKVELDRWIILLDNLYTENTDITIALNRALNKSWLEFWNGLEPSILKELSVCFTGMLNKVFEIIAYDDMFLPDHIYSSIN